MGRYLTYEDRITIEHCLEDHLSYAEIARRIGKSRSCISREVRLHKKEIAPRKNICQKHGHCHPSQHCKYEHCGYRPVCTADCGRCQTYCEEFEERRCEKAMDYPYGCNTCENRGKKCALRQQLYSAYHAEKEAKELWRETRKGISLSEEEFLLLDRLVVEKLKQGRSIHVIQKEIQKEVPVCERTIYYYMQHGLFSTDRLVLRRTMQRAYRKKSGPVRKVDKRCHIGRTYEDYLVFREEDKDAPVVQMDSVLGTKGGKCLLTLLFENCDLQLMYLREANTAKSVADGFLHLRETLGEDDFRKLFRVILTDRGSEFTDPSSIEADPITGEVTTRLFYCDPMQTNQKSRCERNHEFIRYILPKGKPMTTLTQDKVTLMMNHINSYPRKKWNDRSPIDVFTNIYGKEIAEKLGLEKIPSQRVLLRPDLMK